MGGRTGRVGRRGAPSASADLSDDHRDLRGRSGVTKTVPVNFLQPVIQHRAYSEYEHSLTFRVRRYVVNETRAPIANPPNSAQLEGTPYHSPSYIRVRAVVWACGERQAHRQTDRQTHTQTRLTNIHFASSTTHAKCNKWSKKFEKRPHRRCSRTVQSHSPCGASVPSHVGTLAPPGEYD